MSNNLLEDAKYLDVLYPRAVKDLKRYLCEMIDEVSEDFTFSDNEMIHLAKQKGWDAVQKELSARLFNELKRRT